MIITSLVLNTFRQSARQALKDDNEVASRKKLDAAFKAFQTSTRSISDGKNIFELGKAHYDHITENWQTVYGAYHRDKPSLAVGQKI